MSNNKMKKTWIPLKQSKPKQIEQGAGKAILKTGFDCCLTLIGSTNMFTLTHARTHANTIAHCSPQKKQKRSKKKKEWMIGSCHHHHTFTEVVIIFIWLKLRSRKVGREIDVKPLIFCFFFLFFSFLLIDCFCCFVTVVGAAVAVASHSFVNSFNKQC